MARPDDGLLRAVTYCCVSQGTALNQRTIPTANVNLGPSLGTRSVAIGGALAAVVEFNDTYDGGALGNVNIKILPGNKTLTTSSVPLLWNDDISDPNTRSESNFGLANSVPGGKFVSLANWFERTGPWANGAIAAGVKGMDRQGCGDWTSLVGAQTSGGSPNQYAPQQLGAPAGDYKALFWDAPGNLGFGTYNGLPGYTEITIGGSPNGLHLGRYVGVDNPLNIQAGGVVGNNEWIGTNPNPFPTGSAPTNSGNPNTYSGGPAAPLPFNYNASNTVLRTNALSLGIAPGGVSVDMSTGQATPPGGLTTAQGSQDVTLGYSGGQANLFGNIPGKNVGIDVTVNLATKINSIVRIMDQDLYKNAGTVEGEDLPAGLFNCRQIVTGAVQNYIPGVRLTGSLRIAPAITKDGKVRIAKATVQSDVNNPDRVALSACLFPAKPYNDYQTGGSTASGMPFGGWTDQTQTKFPTASQAVSGATFGTNSWPSAAAVTTSGIVVGDGNTSLPLLTSTRRYPNLAEGNAPSTTPCGTDATTVNNGKGLAEVIRRSGLTGTVSGLPTPTDPAYAGVLYKGDQASVAGDITVNPIDVDVLLGDQPVSGNVPQP